MVTHYHGGREVFEVDDVPKVFRTSEDHSLRQREMRRIRVGGPMVNEGHLPVHPRREVDDRRGVRPRTQYEKFGWQA